jgi:hypothetical protein
MLSEAQLAATAATGFIVVPDILTREEVETLHQTVTDSTPLLMFRRTILRAIDAIPPVKRRVVRRLGEE